MNLIHTWFKKSPTTSSGVVAWLEDVELGTGPLPVAPPPPALWPPLPPFGDEAEEEFVVAVLSPTRLEEPRRLPLCTMVKKNRQKVSCLGKICETKFFTFVSCQKNDAILIRTQLIIKAENSHIWPLICGNAGNLSKVLESIVNSKVLVFSCSIDILTWLVLSESGGTPRLSQDSFWNAELTICSALERMSLAIWLKKFWLRLPRSLK